MLKRLERIQRLSVVYERLKRDFDGNSLAASVNASNGDFERAKAQADVAIGLLQEYGELYRHYDTQRAAYVSALTAIAVTATAADFYAKLPQSVEILDQVIIYPLATILFSLGSVGFIATRKSRLRMKLFYARFSDLRKIVD
ncbi:MAG TPA: hypothetical protein PKM48_15660, partial [Parvularculaceae bacterium]|nr:hypothetical protein [Parvularculaceae bacterium]